MTTTGARKPHGLMVPLLLGAALVVPFLALQLINRRAFQETFPFVLFFFMSVHALMIALLITPALRQLRARPSLAELKPGHWIGLLAGVVLVWAYVGVVRDQMPCFLGVPNCD